MAERSLLTPRTIFLFFVVAAAVLALAALLSGESPRPFVSTEVTVAAYSPRGSEGGAVIPASCPSYAHVSGQCTPPSFSASDTSLNEGETATLTWSCNSTHNTSSSGSNFSTGGALSGSRDVAPSDTTEYGVVCNPTGTSAYLTVTVLHPVLSISANPVRVRSGNSSTITWSASEVNSGSCSVSGPSFSGSGESGSQSTGAITAQSTYTLTCSTDAGPTSASVVVTLIPSIIETGGN